MSPILKFLWKLERLQVLRFEEEKEELTEDEKGRVRMEVAVWKFVVSAGTVRKQ